LDQYLVFVLIFDTCFVVVVLCVLGIQPRAWHMLGKHSISELSLASGIVFVQGDTAAANLTFIS
jgi:hypothetical protein